MSKLIEKKEITPGDKINSVLYFTASYCAPCRMLGPLIEGFSEEFQLLNFIKVDIENAPEVAREYGVQSIPTVKLFINGDEKRSFVGLKSKQSYSDAFREYSGG
jgi:thioredoxin 1